jgi:rubrerythrin
MPGRYDTQEKRDEYQERKTFRRCERKVRYSTAAEAESAKDSMQAKHGESHFDFYPCENCGGFHVGTVRQCGYCLGYHFGGEHQVKK